MYWKQIVWTNWNPAMIAVKFSFNLTIAGTFVGKRWLGIRLIDWYIPGESSIASIRIGDRLAGIGRIDNKSSSGFFGFNRRAHI